MCFSQRAACLVVMISRRQTVLLYCCYTTTTSPRLRVEIARRSALGTRPFNGSKFASYATASSSRSELSRVCQAWAARNQYIPLSLPAGWWYTVIARCCSAQAQGETGLPGEDRTRVRRGPLARSLALTLFGTGCPLQSTVVAYLASRHGKSYHLRCDIRWLAYFREVGGGWEFATSTNV